MSARQYRVAVVGGAGMWGRLYLQTYAAHPRCEVVGLVDRARERREQFAVRYGVGRTYDTVEELLAADTPDIVSVAVPVSQNWPVVRACAQAGVRVVSCEKPISATLSEADAIVDTCRQHGTLLACAQAAWARPNMREAAEWIHAGSIGAITGAIIPGGLPVEVSGAGCVQLAALRLITGLDVEWVEGWELPPVPGYVVPGTDPVEADVPAYGRIGLSGGAVCEVPAPGEDPDPPCFIAVVGERGRVWFTRPRPVLVQGEGLQAMPVFPDFLSEPAEDFFGGTIRRLLEAFDTGAEPLSSGEDYRWALETAMAFKLSAAQGHKRVALPLADRSQRLLPHPYRLTGGDVAGWQSIGYPGPPRPPLELRAVASFEQLWSVAWSDLGRVLEAADPADLAAALSTGPAMARKRAMYAVPESKRARYRQAMEASEQATPEQVAAAQQRIVALAQQL